MSRYYPITKPSGAKISLAHGGGTADPITFKKQSKTEHSYLTRGGSSGTSQERSSVSPGKMTGEY